MKYTYLGILFASFLVGSLYGYETQEREAESRFAIQLGWLNHQAGESKIDSTHAMFRFEFNAIYNRWLLGVHAGIGASVSDVNGKAPLVGIEALSTAPVRGGVFVMVDYEIYGAYNLIARQHDRPLSLGIALRSVASGYGYGNAPATSTLSALYLPIQLRGDYALSPKTSLEYLLSYDKALNEAVVIEGMQTVNRRGGDIFRVMLGLRNYISKDTFFYAQLVAQLASYSAASQSIRVQTAIDSNTPGIIPGAVADVHYPKSRTNFVGMRVGFGF